MADGYLRMYEGVASTAASPPGRTAARLSV
jgi:hypothetical protein